MLFFKGCGLHGSDQNAQECPGTHEQILWEDISAVFQGILFLFTQNIHEKNIKKNSIYICKNYSKTGTIPGFAEKMKIDGSGYSLLHKAAEVLDIL